MPSQRKQDATLSFYFKRFQTARIPLHAAALAYHTVLAIVPMIALIFWYLSSIHVVDDWLAKTQLFILQQLNVASSEVFRTYFERLTRSARGHSWGWIGLAILIYTVWSLIYRFGESLDTIVGTRTREEVRTRKVAILMIRRFVVMTALPVALAISLGVGEWLRRDSWLHYVFQLPAIGKFLALPLAWIGTIVSITLVYHFVPRYYVKWGEAFRVAVLVGVATELVRWGFSFYSSYSVATYKIYGVLAVVPLFILWVQIGWMLLLVGALLLRPS